MNYIDKAEKWNERLKGLMDREGYTQEKFLSEFQKKYQRGTQTDISRWLRVGYKIKTSKSASEKEIGFPSYENMQRIADLFNVSVGYLLGETTYESFDMEKACTFLKIDEETGKAIQGIATAKSCEDFPHYLEKEYQSILRYLVTSKSFPLFIKQLRELAQSIYENNHPINHFQLAKEKLNPSVLNLAIKCMDYTYNGEIDEFKENGITPTDELINAINILNKAVDDDYCQEQSLPLSVKLSKYELQETYFHMIEEIMDDTHLNDMIIPHFEKHRNID